MKLSSLFCLIEDLVEENHSLVRAPRCRTPQMIRTTNMNKAYLLGATQTPSVDLWEEGRNSLTTCHIRIDQYYSSEDTQLSLAHYTEVHLDPQGFLVTIHVYFNEQGHLETVAKQSGPSNPEKETIFLLSDNQKKTLNYRVREALPLFKDLIFEKSTRRLKAIEKAKHFEEQLTELSRNLKEPTNRSEYRRIAALFSQHIQFINRYEDKIVYRSHSLVNKIIEKMDEEERALLAQGSLTIGPSEESEDQKVITDQTPTKSTPDHPLKKQSIDTQRASTEKTEALLETLKVNLEKTTLTFQVILDAFPIKQAIEDHMLELLFSKKEASAALEKKKATKHKKILKQAQDTITQYHTKKMEVLDNCFWKGDLNSFEKLLDFVSDNELLEAIKKWFNPLITTEKTTYSDKTIAILNFLSKNSNIYKNYVSTLERLVFGPPGKSIRYFFMMKLHFNDHLNLFEMFLDQGFDPNGLGDSGCKNKYLSLVKAIAYFDQKRAHFYIKKLLEMGALLDMINTDLEPYLNKETKNELSFTLGLQDTAKDLEKETENLSTLPDLLIAAQQNAFDVLKVMIPYAEGYSISLALVYLNSLPSFRRAIVYHQEGMGIALYSSQQTFEDATKSDKLIGAANHFRILMFYTGKDLQEPAYQAMQALYLAFLKKHPDPNTLRNSHKKLDFLLEKSFYFTENDFYVVYMAKIFLIAQQYNRLALKPDALEEILKAYHEMSLKSGSRNKTPSLKTMKMIGETFTLALTDGSKKLLEEASRILQREEATPLQQTSRPRR